MLEPSLQHHRERFDRLKRHQVRLAVGAILAPMVFVWPLILFVEDEWVERILLVYLGAFFVVYGVLEIRKAIVFREDLHDQRDS